MDQTSDTTVRQLLRHMLSTVAYRGSKTLRGAPASFAAFRAAQGTRTPIEILSHIGCLFDWALKLAEGRSEWNEPPLGSWDEEVARFHASLAAFDAYLASDKPLGTPAEKLFQGPIADALTHFGQIGMLRRMAGAPVRGENYARAYIAAGQVDAAQPEPVFEFD